uniref:WRKY domain-containing protein n=1 Tax=Rhizophora mucronata TaxID=61149 RepID=A0A2P2IM13_RHIMU
MDPTAPADRKKDGTLRRDDGEPNNSGAALRGSIAERRAAKFGFNADRISTARFRTTTSSPLASPSAARSPCITIPPGISPTALLDSPIMLPNSQPSPTTGTYPLPVMNYESSVLSMVPCANGDRSSNGGSSFTFKPHCSPDCFPSFSNSDGQEIDIACQALVSVEQPMDFEFPADHSSEVNYKRCTEDGIPDVKDLNSMGINVDSREIQMHGSDVASNQTFVQGEPIHAENIGMHHSLGEQQGTFPVAGLGRTSEDGYNWRKYGQKQVKGSEYPRSYYKCTYPSCKVKKKIERSHDGQITEIIYKGAHNHPTPQPSRRAQLGCTSSLDEMAEVDESSETCVRVEGGSVWKNQLSGPKDIKFGSDWRVDGLERTSSTSVVTELSNSQGKLTGTFESVETPELSSTLASHDDADEAGDDGATHGMMLIGVDADDDEESETKRRKTETCLIETNLASRAVREPRVVVQIESEADILEDGYRWRKYGQKVVKGNPNPRSYYKCTSAGCSVRKHVERASHNLKYVITTYEGKHNHEVPAARNGAHANSSGSHLAQASLNAQPSLALTRNTNGPKLETKVQDLAPSFDRKQAFNSNYLRPSFSGNFSNEMKLGASSIYSVKCPSLQNALPYGSFGFNPNHGASLYPGSIASLIPDFPMPVPSNLQTSASLSFPSVGFNGNGKPASQVQPFPSGQLIRPKQEQGDDNIYNAGPSIINQVNMSSMSSSPAIYNSNTGNFQS